MKVKGLEREACSVCDVAIGYSFRCGGEIWLRLDPKSDLIVTGFLRTDFVMAASYVTGQMASFGKDTQVERLGEVVSFLPHD